MLVGISLNCNSKSVTTAVASKLLVLFENRYILLEWLEKVPMPAFSIKAIVEAVAMPQLSAETMRSENANQQARTREIDIYLPATNK